MDNQSLRNTAKWQQSTFSTAYENTGTSQVAMEEYWIGKPSPYYKDIKESFEYCVDDYTHFHDNIKSQNILTLE